MRELTKLKEQTVGSKFYFKLSQSNLGPASKQYCDSFVVNIIFDIYHYNFILLFCTWKLVPFSCSQNEK